MINLLVIRLLRASIFVKYLTSYIYLRICFHKIESCIEFQFFIHHNAVHQPLCSSNKQTVSLYVTLHNERSFGQNFGKWIYFTSSEEYKSF